jgi:hypothetical protein
MIVLPDGCSITHHPPAERYAGQDRALPARHYALYQQARGHTPRRWSGQTRNWTPRGRRDTQPRAECHDPGGLGPEPIKHTKPRGRINKDHCACRAATCLTFTDTATAEALQAIVELDLETLADIAPPRGSDAIDPKRSGRITPPPSIEIQASLTPTPLYAAIGPMIEGTSREEVTSLA